MFIGSVLVAILRLVMGGIWVAWKLFGILNVFAVILAIYQLQMLRYSFFWFRMYSSSWLILLLILVGYRVSSECCIQPNFHVFSVIVFNVRESSLSQTLLQGATSPKMWRLPEFCKFNFLLLFFVSAMLTFFSCFYSN